MIQILVNSDLFGKCPSLLEMVSSIDNIPLEELIEVCWRNSKEEQESLRHYKNRKFKLYVFDLPSKERATAVLGLPLSLDANLVGSACIALTNKKLYDWRECSRSNGSIVSKHIILKLAADEIRKGNKPRLAYIAKDILLDGVSSNNADTLLRLRSL